MAEQFMRIGGTDGSKARALRTDNKGRVISKTRETSVAHERLEENTTISVGASYEFNYDVQNSVISLSVRFVADSSFKVSYRTLSVSGTSTSDWIEVSSESDVWSNVSFNPLSKHIRIRLENTDNKVIEMRSLTVSDFVFKEKEDVRRMEFEVANKQYRKPNSSGYLVFEENIKVPDYAYGAIIYANFYNKDVNTLDNIELRVGVNDTYSGKTITQGKPISIINPGLIMYYIAPEAALVEDYPPEPSYPTTRKIGGFPIRLDDNINIRLRAFGIDVGSGQGVECDVRGVWLI